MKSIIYTSAGKLFLAFMLIITAGNTLSAQQFLTTVDGWNAYVHLPDDYSDSAGKRYPLICFIPGTGECGTDASKLLVYGPSKFVAQGNPMRFMVNGKLEKPIVISIQPSALWPNAYTINRKLDTILTRYRVDLQRVNVTGLSMGGWSWDNYVDNYSPAYTNRITSIVSMSAPEPDNTVSNMRFYAQAGGTFWAFEGNLDLRGNDKIRDTMNRYVAGSARYTLYTGGHCCWNTFYDPTWLENGESVYTWMLKQHKTLINGAQSPQANAGNDSTITSVTINLPLRGLGNDPNGLPINFAWTKVAGPASGAITNPNVLLTSVTGLTLGTYKFELKVVNSLGLVGKDTIVINNGNVVLPVILTDFTAKATTSGTVALQWKTTSEINSDYYVVEKSTSSQSFSEAARIRSTGSSNAEKMYAVSDAFPENGINYYRLKMVDKDGQFAYSKVVSVTVSSSASHSLSFASAALISDRLQLNVSSLKSQKAIVSITDVNGKKVLGQVVSLNKGLNNLTQLFAVPKGVYYATITSGQDRITKAFIRQ